MSKTLAPRAAQRPLTLSSPVGTRSDPYAWLRDDSRSDPEVLSYLRAENAYTDAVLAPLAACEQTLLKELTARIPGDDASVPVWRKGHWYWERYLPDAEYPQLLRRRDDAAGSEPEVLLDIEALAGDRDYFDLGDWAISPDDRWLAYTVDVLGRRQYSLRVRDLQSGADIDCGIGNIEAELVWLGDGQRLLYLAKHPQTLLSCRVMLHRIGTDPALDPVLYEEADPSYFLGLCQSRSEALVFLSCASTDQTQWWFADLHAQAPSFTPVLPREAGHDYDVEHHGDHFLLRTNRDAPDFRLVRVPMDACADLSRWEDVLPAEPGAALEDFEVSTGHLAVVWRRQAALELVLYRLTGTRPEACLRVPAPEAGCLHLIGTPDIASPFVRYVTSSLIDPASTFDLDLRSATSILRQQERVLGGFDATQYRTQRIWAPARDGASVPVTVACHQRTALDGTAPLYLYGYGAYGMSIDPEFDDSWVSLMDRGFVVAIAHVRGGQELGRAWYESGRREHKMNTFTDFIDVRRHLVDQRLADPQRVCAQGGSAGGLLIGAVANLAPEQFRALIAHVPFVDVVNTMSDPTLPLTSNEYEEWGDPRSQSGYASMMRYSPYENLRSQAYPAMMVFTSLWDSQVQYFEPVKWVARLRATRQGDTPLLLQIDLSSGHGGRSGRYASYQDIAREFAFLLWQTASVAPE